MPLSLDIWIASNVSVSIGLFILTIIAMILLLVKKPFTFYRMISNLFNIHRCKIDVDHKVVDKDDLNSAAAGEKDNQNITENRKTYFQKLTPEAYPRKRVFIQKGSPNQVASASSSYSSNTTNQKQNTKKKDDDDDEQPTNSKYLRQVLNVYETYLPVRKKRNRGILILMSAIVIAAVMITFFQGCILASVTVYPGGPCPPLGDMECFYGNNASYFLCKTGENVMENIAPNSASCFRWVARDQTTDSILNQLGICAGLVTVFSAMVEVFIRLLIVSFDRRRGVASGIEQFLQKTTGINNVTQPFLHHKFFVTLPFRLPPFQLKLYRRPWLVILILTVYPVIIVFTAAAPAPLIYWKYNVTAYTFIVLLTITLITLFSLIWVVWEQDEVNKILPGGSKNINYVLDSAAFNKVKALTVDHIKKASERKNGSKVAQNSTEADSQETSGKNDESKEVKNRPVSEKKKVLEKMMERAA